MPRKIRPPNSPKGGVEGRGLRPLRGQPSRVSSSEGHLLRGDPGGRERPSGLCPPTGGPSCRGAKTSVSRVILSSQGQRQISGGITQTAIEVPNGSVTPGRSAQRGTSVSYNPGESELKEHGMRRKPGTKSMTARRSRHAMRSDTRPVSPNDP